MIEELEARLIREGDGVYSKSAWFKAHRFEVYKALQGAVCWEVQEWHRQEPLRRSFYSTLAEALAFVEEQK